jgi:hypothetical protein
LKRAVPIVAAAVLLAGLSGGAIVGVFSALDSVRTPDVARQPGEDLDSYLQRAAELGVIPVWRPGE